MVRVGAFILILALGIYGGIKAWPILRGPSILVENPVSFSIAPRGMLEIRGRTRHTDTLTLNGALVLIDQEGRFMKTLLLPSGGAILSFTATDRFGRTTTEKRVVYIP